MDNTFTPTKANEASLLQTIKAGDQTFIHLIRQRLGIIIHAHQVAELHKTILSACQKFHCPPEIYLQHLKNAPDKSPYLEHLIAGITVGETYFFRDKHQMSLLQDKLIPELIARKRKQQELSIRIWSAGCASGEEIYTIAMLLNEMLKDLDKWTISLLGTDINTFSLHRAVEGRYSEWSMRSINDYHKQKYFTQHGKQYQLHSMLRDRVKFDYLNLNDDSYPSIFSGTNAQDIILCRNVLIYFDSEVITQLMQRLSESLVAHGALILGASDPFDPKIPNLTFHHQLGKLFIRKDDRFADVPTVSPIPRQRTVVKAPKPLMPKVAISDKPVVKPALTTPNYSIAEIQNLIEQRNWQAVMKLPDTSRNKAEQAFVLGAKATALANIGHIENAKRLFEESIAIDATNKYTYFNYALTLNELNHYDLAEASLRKTIFLDHQFVAAHYQLGLLLLRNKHHEAGVKCLKNAMRIAHNQDPMKSVPGSQGLNYGRLSDMLTYEIELYSSGNKHEYVDKNK